MALFIFLVVLGYLMGSICSAVLVCKACSLPDPRIEGSKNPGATNVLRIAGKQYAALVLLADVLKGTIPVVIAQILNATPATIGFTALAAVIGHMYPVFFEFKGGKGVATAIGALFGLQLFVGVLVTATWLLVAKFTRYSSLASIAAICLAPIYSLIILQRQDVFPPLFIMTLLILYKHRNNITRLIDRTEPKIKLKSNVLGEIMEEKYPDPFTEDVPLKKTPKKPEVKPKTTKTTKTTKPAAVKKKKSTKKPTATKATKSKEK